MKIVVLGEGKFGTAIATVLAKNGHEVLLWCHDADIACDINSCHVNTKYFPGLILDKKIKAFTDLHDIKDAGFIFAAIPVKFLRSVLVQAKPFVTKEQAFILLSKGIEEETLLFSSQIAKEILPQINIAVLSGPSFAHEIIAEEFTGVNLSGSENIKDILENKYFKVKLVNDIIGLEVCGAFKNVMTIALGIAQGANFAGNTQAYIFTKALEEIKLLVNKLGGKTETVYGLAGVGDLVLSAFGKASRNLWFGKEIGQGKAIQDILQNNITVEGLNTLKSVRTLANNLQLDLPLCNAVYQIVFELKGADILWLKN